MELDLKRPLFQRIAYVKAVFSGIWSKLIVAAVGVLGFGQAIREEFIPESLQERLRLSPYLPELTWIQWTLITIGALLTFTLEFSFRHFSAEVGALTHEKDRLSGKLAGALSLRPNLETRFEGHAPYFIEDDLEYRVGVVNHGAPASLVRLQLISVSKGESGTGRIETNAGEIPQFLAASSCGCPQTGCNINKEEEHWFSLVRCVDSFGSPNGKWIVGDIADPAVTLRAGSSSLFSFELRLSAANVDAVPFFITLKSTNQGILTLDAVEQAILGG